MKKLLLGIWFALFLLSETLLGQQVLTYIRVDSIKSRLGNPSDVIYLFNPMRTKSTFIVGTLTAAPESTFQVYGGAKINRGIYISGTGYVKDSLTVEKRFDVLGSAAVSDSLRVNNWTRMGIGAQSQTFTSGAFGLGWQLDNNTSVTGQTYLELDNVVIRNTLRTHIFQKDIIRATNGYLYVADASEIINNTTVNGTGTGFIEVKENVFQANDILQYRDIDITGGLVIAGKYVRVDSLYSTITGGFKFAVTGLDAENLSFKTGGTIVRVGNTTNTGRQGAIFFDASSANSPFQDIYDGRNSTTGVVPKVRVGKLSGITDANFGTLSGYGIYTQRGYFKGFIALGSATALNTGTGVWADSAGNFRAGNPATNKFIKFDTGTGDVTFGTAVSLNWSQITGTGKPQDNATVGADWPSNITGRPSRLVSLGDVPGYISSTYIDAGAVVSPEIRGNWVMGGTIIASSGGTNVAGLSGSGNHADSIRIWAGATYANKASAPFRITQDGALTATNATIQTSTGGTRIELTSNQFFHYNGSTTIKIGSNIYESTAGIEVSEGVLSVHKNSDGVLANFETNAGGGLASKTLRLVAQSSTQNAYGIDANASSTSGKTAYGIYANAINGTTNWAGYFDGGNVYIANQIKIAGGTPGSGKVLTSDAAGLATWTTLSGTIPSGVIVMWSGSIASIPSGWALCDGTSGTPDLRDRFIVGAGSTYAVAATGGEATHALTTGELPAHNHSFTADAHNHGITDGGHTHGVGTVASGSGGGFNQYASGTGWYHTSVTTASSTTGISINNATETGSIGNTGSGTAHENRPPYYALAYIMKL